MPSPLRPAPFALRHAFPVQPCLQAHGLHLCRLGGFREDRAGLAHGDPRVAELAQKQSEAGPGASPNLSDHASVDMTVGAIFMGLMATGVRDPARGESIGFWRKMAPGSANPGAP